MKFLDKIQLHLKAGYGGSGVVAFFQDWRQNKPRPVGGNGGNGGSIILIASDKINNLNHFRLHEVIIADSGEDGSHAKKQGKNGSDIKLFVPLGTVLWNKEKKQILFNFEKNNDSFIAAHGGLGGKGNAVLLSNRNKHSHRSEAGTLGEIRTINLELKMIAKVGIIGLPNAGKSSLLSSLTNAHPQIADYQFTTILPNLGVLNNVQKKKILIADLPGIIAGAAQNKGLGNQFLKHAERCYLLIHLIDLNVENVNVFRQNFKIINEELFSYNKHFASIQKIVVGNKIDLPQAQQIFFKLKKEKKFVDCDFMSISAREHIGIDILVEKIWNFFSSNSTSNTVIEKTLSEQNNYNKFVFQPSLERELRLRKIGPRIWELSGNLIQKLSEKYDFSNPTNIIKINHHFKQHHIFECLSEHGLKKGDIVHINNLKLEWKF